MSLRTLLGDFASTFSYRGHRRRSSAGSAPLASQTSVRSGMRVHRAPRGYLLLEVIVSGVILATALLGAMVTMQKASNVMSEANRESQASQVLTQSIATFLAHPYQTVYADGGLVDVGSDEVTLGDVFRCDRTWSTLPTTALTPGGNSLNIEIHTVTVTYNLPNGGQRSITANARRYQIL